MTDPIELLKECILSLRQPSASYGAEWRDRAVATQNAIIAERIEKAIQLIEAERQTSEELKDALKAVMGTKAIAVLAYLEARKAEALKRITE